MNERVFLNMRAGQLTKEAILIAAKKLGKKVDKKTAEEIASAPAGERFNRFVSFFGEEAPEILAKKSGKVGVVYSSKNETDTFSFTDKKYLRNKKYQQEVDRAGVTPDFAKKLEKRSGRIHHLNAMVSELARKSRIVTPGRGDVAKAYKQGVIRLKEEVPVDVLAMKRSLAKIKKNESPLSAEQSVKQGVRFALIDQAREQTKGKMCRILGTTADEPDFEHSLLEGEIMPCEEVLEHLSRWGCQHDFEELN